MEVKGNDGAVIELDATQQAWYRSHYGRQVRRVKVDENMGGAIPLEESCSRCLLSTRFSDVVIGTDGQCNYCHNFDYLKETGELNMSHIIKMADQYRRKDGPDCVVVFAGGKDSATALILAVKVLGLKPVAVFVDNGFIPDEVKENSKQFCDMLGVPFEIQKINIAPFVVNMEYNFSLNPCQICINQGFFQIARVCKDRNLGLVVGGYRCPPLITNLASFTGMPLHQGIAYISPLIGYGLTEKTQIDFIKKEGWKEPEFQGKTCNCLLIGYVDEIFHDRFGYSSIVQVISHEIRAGWYSREVGEKKISRTKLPGPLRRQVEKKLELTY